MSLEKNIWKLKWISILHDFFIVIPILTIFFLARGLNMTEVFIVQSFFALLVLVGEVPSGYFADKFGRKQAIVLGVIIWYIGMVLYPFGYGFWYFMMIEGIIGIGISLMSGADSALLYDSLYSLGRQKEYHKIETEIFTWTGYGLSVASILGGFLATYFIELPFYVEMGFMFFIIPISLSLKEAPMHKHVVGKEIKTMKQALFHYLHEHKEIKWLIIFYGFLHCATLASVWFGQPFWQKLGIPLALFGIIWAFMTFSRALFTKLSPFLDEKLSRKNILILLAFLPFIGYLGLFLFDRFIGSIIFFLFYQAAFGIARPLFKKYINELVSSKVRATVLSINSMFSRLTFVILGPIIGYFFDILTFSQAFLISGIFFFLISMFCVFMMSRYKLV